MKIIKKTIIFLSVAGVKANKNEGPGRSRNRQKRGGGRRLRNTASIAANMKPNSKLFIKLVEVIALNNTVVLGIVVFKNLFEQPSLTVPDDDRLKDLLVQSF